jgi:hypothetical protein
MKNYMTLTFIWLSLLLSSCEEEAADPCTAGFTITATDVISASCGQANGSINLTANGAQGSVSYQLQGGSSNSSGIFEELAPGTYQINAEDAQGCTASISVTVEDEVAEITTQATTSASECGAAQGSITLTASGGEAPYQYSLDGENFRTENEFTQLEPGQYTVTVRDANGCSTEQNASVRSGISFSARISGIVENNCAVTGCHVSGTGRVDFSVKANILDNAAGIRSRTTSGSMPPAASGRSLTDAQIAEIACWVEDGAPDN